LVNRHLLASGRQPIYNTPRMAARHRGCRAALSHRFLRNDTFPMPTSAKSRRSRGRFRRVLMEQLEDRALLAVLPPSGLVAWYRAEGDANDFVGANNGALVGTAGFAPGKPGQAFDLNGQTGFVNVPDQPALNFSQSGTYDAWF